MLGLLRKFFFGSKALLYFVFYKFKYGDKIKLCLKNYIEGSININLQDDAKVSIGKHFIVRGPLNIRSIQNGRLEIGNNVFFNHNCSITCLNGIFIGDNCKFANNIVIVDHDHNISEQGMVAGFNIESVKIGNNVWIGANTVILKGVNIGNNSVVGAGSVVNKDIPERELWAGNPAKRIRKL